MTSDVDDLFEKARERILRELKDFAVEPETSAADVDAWTGTAVTRERLPVPQLARWILIWALGAQDRGEAEKRAWLVPFVFKGHRCSLGLYKFGLRLQIQCGESETADLSSEIVNRIDKAIRVAERDLLQQFAAAQLHAGNVTVQNQFYMFEEMYRDFRSPLESPAASVDNEVVTAADASDMNEAIGAVVRKMNLDVERDRRRFHASVATVTAYFSLLEHLLVLIWPLTDRYEPGVDDVGEMIGKFWGEKFKTVFDINSDSDAKRIYDDLRDIAEKYRNTYAHGGFDKHHGTLAIHFADGTPIPVSLSESRRNLRTTFFPVTGPEVVDILAVLDKTDEWLSEGPASFAMTFVKSGIDVAFNEEGVLHVREQMTSPDSFEKFLEGFSRRLDDLTNMDF